MLGMAWSKRSAVSLFSKIFVVVLAMLIAGCMRPAKFPRRVKVSQILDNLKCELSRSFMEHKDSNPWLLKWTIGYTLTLIVERTIGASTAGSSYVWPVKQGTFGLGLTAALNKSASQTIEIKGNIPDVTDLYKYECASDGSKNRGRLLAGNLGLQQWLRGVVPELRGGPTGDGNDGDATGITYTMNFFITTEGKITPSWALSYGNGRRFSPSLSLSKDKEWTHKLILTLNEPGVADPYTVKLDDPDTVMVEKIPARRVYIANMSELAAELANIEDERVKMKLKESNTKVRTLSRKTEKFGIAKSPELTAAIAERDKLKVESENASRSANIAKNKVKAPVPTAQPSRRRAYDAETQRTIDQAITRQVIRDAFRR